jgi:hypothetical protein
MNNAMFGLFSLSGGEIMIILVAILAMAAGVLAFVLLALWLLTKRWNSPRTVPPVQPPSSPPSPPSQSPEFR